MKALGYLMISAGFLLGTLAAVQTAANEVNWVWFALGIALGIAGIIAARLGEHRESTQADTVKAGFETVTTSLDRVVEHLTALDAGKAEINPYDVHERLDQLFPKDLANFAEGRESIAKLYGLKAYAEVMSEFAAGERYLNRVWSASLDGYIDEVNEYLGRSLGQFIAARTKLASLQHVSG